MTATQGQVTAGFEAVAEQFEANFTERGELGAAFAAVVDGELLVDLWGGTADRRDLRAWDEQTLVPIISATKGLVATCLLLLIDRQELDIDRPVAAYWPQFAASGKDRVLVRDLVSHQAGLPGLLTPITTAEATDARRMAALLAAQSAIEPPGRSLGYQAMTFGWICGELVHRIDGRSIGRFFAEEVAAPLGLEAWIGLPAEHEARVAYVERDASFEAPVFDQRTDRLAWSIWSNPPRFSGTWLPWNSRAWHAAEIPATSGIATARSLARLYGCLARGGEIDGIRLVSPETVALGRQRLAAGRDPIVERSMVFGVGFQLQTEVGELGPEPDAFGHAGTGVSVHGAWPALGVGFSYAMNLMRGVSATPARADPRSVALLDALHAAVSATRPARS